MTPHTPTPHHAAPQAGGPARMATRAADELPPALPTVMVDGIEQRRTAPARPDDPAELADLQARIAARMTPAPARPDHPTHAPVSGWRTVGHEQAAHLLAARGVDLDTARTMVTDYLRETSERAGTPADQWGLDQADIAAIAAARERAATDTDEETGTEVDDGHDGSDGAGCER